MENAKDLAANKRCKEIFPALAGHIKARLGGGGDDDALVLLRVQIQEGGLTLLDVERVRWQGEEADDA